MKAEDEVKRAHRYREPACVVAVEDDSARTCRTPARLTLDLVPVASAGTPGTLGHSDQPCCFFAAATVGEQSE